jgi:C4-dicarboxylate-specific signal transduction histidine kinase
VLVLFSNARLLPANVEGERGLREAFAKAEPRVELFAEFLDMSNFGGRAYSGTVATYLTEKYASRPPDVIVAAGDDALEFLLRHRGRLLPGTPIVYMGVSPSELGRMPARPVGVIGVPVEYDFSGTIEQALRLHAQARRLVIVTGASGQDRLWEARLRSEVLRFAGRVTTEFLAALPTDTLLQRLRDLPGDAVVFTPGYFQDGDGQRGTPRASAELIAAASTAPVYGPFDTFLGTGVIGGRMATFESMGRQAGELVMALLGGALPDSLRLPAMVPIELHLDWRQARRWGIGERYVPPGTVWHFRETTLWEGHRTAVVLAILLVLLQAALIGALLVERRSRRRAVVALEESERRTSLAAQAAELSLWNWDFSRDQFWGTGSSWRPRGTPAEAAIGFRQTLEAVHPADREAFERAVRHTIASGEDLDVECRVVRPAGDVRWIVSRGRTSDQRLLGVTLDVTDRRLAELQVDRDQAELRHMTRVSMLGQLSASIAHQMNQPLAAILSNAEAMGMMLERTPLDVVELRAICDDIVAEDARASEVIRRLRALFRRDDLAPMPVDLNELVGETLDLARTHLVERRIVPVVSLSPSLPLLSADRIQLQQVLLNLILNAAEAMSDIEESDRRLTIRTELADTAARVNVTDRGPGIAPGDLANVFEPFWTSKPGGMGVGLAISQAIVAAHRGTLTASNNEGGGATFCLTLAARGEA